MPIYNAYEVKTSHDEEGSLVWWDGERIRSDSKQLISYLKSEFIPLVLDKEKGPLQFSDGEEFFNNIPMLYRNGYTWTTRVKVDEKGRKVK